MDDFINRGFTLIVNWTCPSPPCVFARVWLLSQKFSGQSQVVKSRLLLGLDGVTMAKALEPMPFLQ